MSASSPASAAFGASPASSQVTSALPGVSAFGQPAAAAAGAGLSTASGASAGFGQTIAAAATAGAPGEHGILCSVRCRYKMRAVSLNVSLHDLLLVDKQACILKAALTVQPQVQGCSQRLGLLPVLGQGFLGRVGRLQAMHLEVSLPHYVCQILCRWCLSKHVCGT